ncbi:MAG TPA: FprA family A-type flavoprotein [Thermodesulfovibrionia bacterium]|nr:FprA family A-type flavoprotein [Thermodesulfovibrionia bacterium]
MTMMKSIELKPNIYWVGAIDWAVRDFHGYITPNGTTYNNYLILDKEVTLLDTVKYEFANIGINNIKRLIEPYKIKNIVINHIENDHMGALGRMMEIVPYAILYTSERGKRDMARFFDTSKWNIEVVKTGDELNIGEYTLKFIETPMLHWPDSMMTYVDGAKLLISQDAFGQHFASAARFDDLFIEFNSEALLEDAMLDYYANILMPFGKLIKTKIAEIVKTGWDIDMIAPDHGLVWRKHANKALQMYQEMADGKAQLRVTVIYDTMWHGTEQMTQPLMLGIKDGGVYVKVLKLRSTPLSVAIKEFWKSRASLIGSPTLNNGIFPSVAEFITHLKGLRPKHRMVGAFGSYGWGGGAVPELFKAFRDMKLEVVEPGITINYRPDANDEERCYNFGREFAEKVKEYHKNFQ